VPTGLGAVYSPPVSVRIMMLGPTAVPVLASPKETPEKAEATSIDCCDQVALPSFVRKIAACPRLVPTANQVLRSASAMARRIDDPPRVSWRPPSQVVPPSVL
jgi:hypothetical protein